MCYCQKFRCHSVKSTEISGALRSNQMMTHTHTRISRLHSKRITQHLNLILWMLLLLWPRIWSSPRCVDLLTLFRGIGILKQSIFAYFVQLFYMRNYSFSHVFSSVCFRLRFLSTGCRLFAQKERKNTHNEFFQSNGL